MVRVIIHKYIIFGTVESLAVVSGLLKLLQEWLIQEDPEQHVKNCRPHLPQLRQWFNNKQETGQKWENSKEKTTADQKEDFWGNIL